MFFMQTHEHYHAMSFCLKNCASSFPQSILSDFTSKSDNFVRVTRPFFTCTSNLVRRKWPIIPEEAEKLPVFQYPVSSERERRVYAWGLAEHGALGNHLPSKEKKPRYLSRPVRLHFGEKNKISDIACGYGFTAFAVSNKEKYKVFGCGINTDSQIGYHAPRRGHPLGLVLYPAPVELPFKHPQSTKVLAVAAGRAHLLILTDNEGVFSLGNNAYGQCARRIIEQEEYSGSSFVQNILNLDGNKIDKIVCGQDHSIFMTEAGQVYACGWGADGQTGQGHHENTAQPRPVVGDIKGENITKVACSVDCVLALNDRGEVFGWGNSEYGQLQGNVKLQQSVAVRIPGCDGLGRIVDIAAGGSYCVVVNEHGDVFSWGYGILGRGPEADFSEKPTQIPATLFGKNEFDPHTCVVAVSSGTSHTAAVTNSGSVYTWGRNKGGCLGLGHLKDQYFPLRVALGAKVKKISCGVDHTIALCQPYV